MERIKSRFTHEYLFHVCDLGSILQQQRNVQLQWIVIQTESYS